MEASKIIISDYFIQNLVIEISTTKNIIFFKNFPIFLPERFFPDMEKMFILVNIAEDLQEVINDIKEISENRIRYDDIIEIYSSEKCDIKKLVSETIKVELGNA